MVKLKKRGRPKGSRNKIITAMKEAIEHAKGNDVGAKVTTWEVAKFSRFDECITNLETAVAEAIAKLKASI